MKSRKMVLAVLAVATLGAVWWASGLEDTEDAGEVAGARPAPRGKTRPATQRNVGADAGDASQGTVRKSTKPRATSAGAGRSLETLNVPRGEWSPMKLNLFAAQSFLPPPPPPPPAAPPEPPRAPPLRFQYIGMLDEKGQRQVFVNDNNQVLILHEGDTVGTDYRVEKITANSVVFMYLPLQEQQTLMIGKN